MVRFARTLFAAAAIALAAGPLAAEPRQAVRPTICSLDHGLALALSARAFLARTLLLAQLAPTQLAAFESFRAVFEGQVETVRRICPDAKPLTPAEELEIALRQIDASLNAIRTIRSAANAFYATLSAEQKSQLGSFEPWFVLGSSVWSDWALSARSGQRVDIRRLGPDNLGRPQECTADLCICVGDRCYAVPREFSQRPPGQYRWRDQEDLGKLWTE
jgi:LTXXQ motif family protein